MPDMHMPDLSAALLRAALDLGDQGIPTFPCGDDKAPLTPSGHKDASTNPTELRRMFDAAGGAVRTLGMPTGRASGLWVLDADVDEDVDGLAWIAAHAEHIPETRIVATRGGGRHHVFALPEGADIRNSIGKVAPGIDVRGEGGYVIVPPSPGYIAVNDVDPAPASPWLVQQVSRPRREPLVALPAPRLLLPGATDAVRRYVTAALEAECKNIRAAPFGQQEVTLNRAAFCIGGLVRHGVLGRDEAFNALLAAASTMASRDKGNEWTMEGLRRKIGRSLRDGTARCDRPHPAEVVRQHPAPQARRAETGRRGGTAAPEPDPQPAAPDPAEGETEAEGETWRDGLVLTGRGTPAPLPANVAHILEHHPAWRGGLAYDAFANEVVLRRPPPWRPEERWEPRPVVGNDLDEIAHWMQRNGVAIHENRIAGALEAAARRTCTFHPVRDYLNALAWDGRPRLDLWLTTYLRVEATRYTRAVAAAWPISAVARVMQPGCKADYAIVLEGPQGLGKSTVGKILAGGKHFTDHLPDLHQKDAMAQLQGKWVLELGEMSAITRSQVDMTKRFMSTQVDRFRPSYGRVAQDFPRQCVFLGSVNPSSNGYLMDPTGDRRFWVIECGDAIDLPRLERDRDQLWAEAVHRYRAGECWHLTDPAALAEAKQEQAARFRCDPREELVEDFLTRLGPEAEKGVSMLQIMANGLCVTDPSKQDMKLQKLVGDYLTRHGWKGFQKRRDGSRRWLWFPPGTPGTPGGE